MTAEVMKELQTELNKWLDEWEEKATMDLRNKIPFFMQHCAGYYDIVAGTSPLLLPKAKANGLKSLTVFGGTEQRNLPKGNTQIEYVYMTSGSYIKIEDLPLSAGYRVEYEFQTTSLSASLRNYIGGRANGVSAGGGFRLSKLASTNNNRVVLYGFETGTEYYDPTVQFQPDTRYKYTYDNGVCTLESGGSVVSTRTFTVTDNTSTKWGINCYVSGNDYWQTDSDGIYAYSLKVWDAQGELVMDLVPDLTNLNIVCFYDMITGNLREATAGTFEAGPTAVPTPDYPMNIITNNGVLKVDNQGNVYADGTVETIADNLNNTAAAEMLLKVGDYQDTQEVIAGNVTRRIGIKVLDGTEDWVKASNYTNIFYAPLSGAYYNDTSAERIAVPCTHFVGTDATNTNMADNSIKLTAQGSALTNPLVYIKASVSENNLTIWQNWLAAQYQNGTPVIIVFPLKIATAETVAGQTLNTKEGSNSLTITQASLEGLTLEARYKRGR